MTWMFLPFRRYAEFAGRSRRTEFWLFFLFLLLVYLLMFALVTVIAVSVAGSSRTLYSNLMAVATSLGVLGLVVVVFWLATFLPWLAVSARRLHDIGLSGWWLLPSYLLWLASQVLNYIARVNFDPMMLFFSQVCVWLWLASGVGALIVFCLPGTRGANRYGPDPMGPTDVADVFA